MITVTTESGSVYEIDDSKKTWKRFKGEDAADIRSESGEFLERSETVIGLRMTLICPPFFEDDICPRAIITTRVVKVEGLN